MVYTAMLAVVLAACGGESWTADEVGLGSVTLSWTPPTLNTDGSPLTDLAGYRIYYGTQPDHYRVIVQLDNPGLATYVVDYLPADTYYFVMTAVNSTGVESAFSGEASVQVF